MSKDIETVIEVLGNLNKTRQHNEYHVDQSGAIIIRDKCYEPAQIKAIKSYRFEGDSGPADDAVISIVETIDGMVAYHLDKGEKVGQTPLNEDYSSLVKSVYSLPAEREIRRLVNAHKLLERKNRNLQIINDDLNNFVNTASHDLLAPLANIELSIKLIDNVDNLNSEVKEYLNIVAISIAKFRSLIKDIAQVGVIEGDMLQLQSVDVAELIDNVEWSLDKSISAEHAVINRNIEVQYIMFSRKNLRSIIYNLVSNAIKFRNGTSPMISIEVKKAEEGVILSVEDNGIGIPPEHQAKIFNLYGRLQPEIEGKGIGLYLVKKIIDSIEGSISVESEVDHGSRFSIFFPDRQPAI